MFSYCTCPFEVQECSVNALNYTLWDAYSRVLEGLLLDVGSIYLLSDVTAFVHLALYFLENTKLRKNQQQTTNKVYIKNG